MGSNHVTREEYRLQPNIPVIELMEPYGNLCQRLITSEMDQDPGAPFIEVQQLSGSVPTYLLPSRYCESDRFSQMATEITAGLQPGYDQVAAIVD